MFFLKEETKVISLHPSYFGPNVREYLINRLNEEEEGRCTGDHFVICVMDMVDIGEGRVLPSNGQAEYTIKYRAIIWKPFRGETVCSRLVNHKPDLTMSIGRCVCHVGEAHRDFHPSRPIVGFYCAQSMFFVVNIAVAVSIDANGSSRIFLPTSDGSRTQCHHNTLIMRIKLSRRAPTFGLKFLVSSRTLLLSMRLGQSRKIT